ncbi:hypothetical protein AUJ42_01510 [Candidatus Collierbacteria bacterium CG1_02_44_10]|uniref:Uncharacterized protein n=2 Tax=Candidatus Collieribacteriota TaxID=1752725 RepID=A0A2M8BTP7_9BACT|nr:MAG: hypothetical protein AUJ42_01510 [Candidatus Collierbacteria bacterium CG1_02_44_10]PJB47244.1 MAG: hypothetical protein CO104_04115 [Candidatus Collierbacteria bacterium CG_4_9_14_3_um_filter_43_16]
MPGLELEIKLEVGEEAELQALYRKQEALQGQGGVEQLRKEVASLLERVEKIEVGQVPEEVRKKLKDIIDMNVGVVDAKVADELLQGVVNGEISRLTDEVFRRTHPRVYELARSALLSGLPEGFDLYDTERIKKKIFGVWNPVTAYLRAMEQNGECKIVACMKPVRSTAMEALRQKMGMGTGDKLEKYGNFEELEARVNALEKSLEEGTVGENELDYFNKLIEQRYDRFRCRVFSNGHWDLSNAIGTVKILSLDWMENTLMNKIFKLTPDWDYYLSEWIYRRNGDIESKELRGYYRPPNSRKCFSDELEKLEFGDMLYLAWHTHLKLKLGWNSKQFPVEIQILPAIFPMNLMERVYKQEDPDLKFVSPKLREKAWLQMRKFILPKKVKNPPNQLH